MAHGPLLVDVSENACAVTLSETPAPGPDMTHPQAMSNRLSIMCIYIYI